MLLACLTAAGLRFWQLGDVPPGLYRDEATNGLDALAVLDGRHALFFEANNGREPAYIYLTAVSILLFGRTAVAVRLAAAVVGTLATLSLYQLASHWFNRRVGLYTAWLWAITVWPVHLSRIGLRPILLIPALALALWLATRAYREQNRWLWLGAGGLYGLSFYTYLAARATPAVGLLFGVYLLRRGRQAARRRLWPGLAWLALGWSVAVLPLGMAALQNPEIIAGRAGQVSIFNPAIHGGDFWGTLWRHTGRGLGLFFWRGDEILRHNPAGRPLFGLALAVPFCIGVLWCLQNWKKPPATALLVWTGVMLLPTILAEDTPHFLRAVGILPAALMFPALGLSQIADLFKLARLWQPLGAWLAAGLIAISLGNGVRDYFWIYARQPDTAYLFEAAARDMAMHINAEPEDSLIFVEQLYWENWPSLRFLVQSPKNVRPFEEIAASEKQTPFQAFYVWPHAGDLDPLYRAIQPPALVSAEIGALARGDLEPEAYPLFVRFAVRPRPETQAVLANFGHQFNLHRTAVEARENGTRLRVTLHWSTSGEEVDRRPPVVAFVHVRDTQTGTLVGQDDAVPGSGYWPSPRWQPGLTIQDAHLIELTEPYRPERHQILVGLYPAGAPQDRLPVSDAVGKPAGDAWPISTTTGQKP